MKAGWQPTAGWYRLLGICVVTLGLAIGAGRVDLAILGAPFVLLLVMGLLARPGSAHDLIATASVPGIQMQGEPATLHIALSGTDGAQLVAVSVPTSDGRASGQLMAVPAGHSELTAQSVVMSWGPVLLARPDVAAVGADGLWDTAPVLGTELFVRVAPTVQKVDGLQLLPILGGWSGEHLSRRPGQGNELIDLREYVPGDRLRSIHWRAYARHQKLYVRRTESSADAEFAVCLDTRHDIGAGHDQPRSHTWLGRTTASTAKRLDTAVRWWRTAVGHPPPPPVEAPSSLDLMVAAAAAISATQLRVGDRVGVLDLAAPGRHFRMGTGTRHLERIRQQLADLTPSNSAFVLRPDQWRLPAAAVVVFCSALVDDTAVQAALDVRSRGHQVQVIDVLPVHALLASAGRWHLLPGDRAARILRFAALQVLLAERDVRLDRVRAAGIPILRWEGGQLGTDIRVAMRARRARR